MPNKTRIGQSTTDVDCVSNPAIWEYEQSLQNARQAEDRRWKTEVEAVPRTKSRHVGDTNLGCAAFQENIDRDLNVATKSMVRAGRAKRRNEEKQLDLQHPGRHQKRMQWSQQHDLGLTFVRPRWKRLADSCPCSGTSAGVARSPSHM